MREMKVLCGLTYKYSLIAVILVPIICTLSMSLRCPSPQFPYNSQQQSFHYTVRLWFNGSEVFFFFKNSSAPSAKSNKEHAADWATKETFCIAFNWYRWYSSTEWKNFIDRIVFLMNENVSRILCFLNKFYYFFKQLCQLFIWSSSYKRFYFKMQLFFY